ncbi:RNA-directed DNA polymerase, eukaryota, reverse transcriptase zinc-binding domain protein [Tanacetum coccineum]
MRTRPSFRCNRIGKISMEDARNLERKIDEKEIWEAVRGCSGNKAPGPDGFNFMFTTKTWDIIKKDLIEAITWFWKFMEISRGCNTSFITIIPKVKDPIGLGDFRPISLIGCYYKIITKILAERVKRVMGFMVGEAQNAFIRGRYVLDGVIIANETMTYLKQKKEKCLIFKVDFEKAYDIIINGSPSEEFEIERGVRQGDLLAPFLFILMAEGLNSIVSEAVEKGIFRGVKIGDGGLNVGSLREKNFALLGRWWWRFKTEGGGLWARVIKSIHEIGAEIEGVGVHFTSLCVGVLGDGRDIRFWEDRWNWAWEWNRTISGRMCKEYGVLIEVLHSVVVSNSCRDRWRWMLDEDGDFKVKTLTSLIEEKILQGDSGGVDTIWNKLVPNKVNIFVWRVRKGRFSVRVELDRRGIDLDSVLCTSCINSVGSCAHCLVTCDFAMSVWSKLFNWWKVGNANIVSVDDILTHSGNVSIPTTLSYVWQAVIWTSSYFIWKDRNARVFGNKISSVNKILQDIQFKSFEWIVRRSKKYKSIDWQHWLRDP